MSDDLSKWNMETRRILILITNSKTGIKLEKAREPVCADEMNITSRR